MINWLDFCLILLILIGVTAGYFQGLLRQVMNLASMYLAAILAAQYYHLLGSYLGSQLTTTPGGLLNGVSFFVILIGVTGLLNILTYGAYRTTKLTHYPLFDRTGGMLVGFIAAWILIAMAINVLGVAASTQYWSSAEDFRQLIKSGIAGSQFAAMSALTLPGILNAIKPWLPMGLPSIFNI